VALNVIPGSARWDNSTFIRNGNKIVESCGGGLLEVDEETRTVNFIHSAVMQYITSNPDRRSTKAERYKLPLPIADRNMGYLCITYLNFDNLSSQIAPVSCLAMDSRNFMKKTTSSFGESKLVKTLRQLRKSTQEANSFKVDIGNALQRFRRRTTDEDPSRGLLEYAKRYWVSTPEYLLIPMTVSVHDSESYSHTS
jgi:hypothetical protein